MKELNNKQSDPYEEICGKCEKQRGNTIIGFGRTQWRSCIEKLYNYEVDQPKE